MTIDDLLQLLREVVPNGVPLDPDTPLLSSGLVDSFHMAELIAALSSQTRVRIDLAEVGADNCDTARQMLAFVQSRA